MLENINQFFESFPDFGRVPTIKTQLDWKRELLTIRPLFTKEGWTLLLRLVPNRKSFINNLVCILLYREIKVFEKEYLLKILPLFVLDQKSFSLKKLELVRGLILANSSIKRDEIWKKAEVFEEILGFKPSPSLTGITTKVICEKVWFGPKKVIYPQRKRGYDDKGSLPPKDSVSWRELASNSVETYSSNDVSIQEKPSGIWRLRLTPPLMMTELTVEIPEIKEIL